MKKIITISLILLIVGVLGVYLMGSSLSAAQLHSVGDPPENLKAEVVSIRHADGKQTSGWFIQGKMNEAGLLLLHSVRSDRREMLGRAEFLAAAGYSVLLIDMQAHGETEGGQITFGYEESQDVHAALDFLRTKVPGQKVGVVGASLGGAAALLGEYPVEADVVILEAVYSSIEQAVKNRISIRFGKIGGYLSPLLTWQIGPRLGVSSDDLSPLNAIERLKSPVLIIAGTDDQHTLLEESQRLFERANESKEFWAIKGAKHQNFHLFDKASYEDRVLEFLHRHL